jgi:hypothetical protein
MKKRSSLKCLANHVLLKNLRALIAREREVTAEVLAHIAEVDARKLYLAEGYPSMFAWCVGELGFSEDATFKRTQAARAAPDASERGRIVRRRDAQDQGPDRVHAGRAFPEAGRARADRGHAPGGVRTFTCPGAS